MALPLPRVIPDVGPGGPLVTAMGGVNSLANNMLLRKINEVKNIYAPLTTQAEAASKLAYANLMGPQFLAKLLGNDAALANMGDQQAKAALQKALSAGMGQGGAANVFSQMPTSNEDNQSNPLYGWFANKLKKSFGMSPQQTINPFASPNPNPVQYNASSSYSSPPEPRAQPRVGDVVEGDTSDAEFDKAYADWQKTPEAQREFAKGKLSNIPSREQLIDRWRAKNGMPMTLTQGQSSPTYAENTAGYKGIIEEGKQLGKNRAQAISDFDEQYQQALQSEVPIDHLIDMTKDPIFQQMRSGIPFFQDKQLDVLSKIGTPEQQKLVGDFITTTTNAVANTVNSFRGRILDKEITMANQMKISPKDTWNTMLGKLASIKTFNEMTKRRSRIASELAQKQHLNRGEALEIADKQINAKKIRNSVEAQLNPKPTEDDIAYMAQKYNISKGEVKKRLKDKGII